MMTRRGLMSAVMLAPLDLTQPPVVRLRPGVAGAVLLETLDGMTLLHAEGIAGAIALPAPVRLAAVLPVGGREVGGRDVAGLAFPVAVDGGRLEMMALAGWDGRGLRLLGLEVGHWHGADGGRLGSRFGGVADRSRLRILREAAVTRAGRPRGWETWTDYLVWRDGAPLAGAAVRAPVTGTWQARLAALRVRVEAALAAPCQAVPEGLLDAARGMFRP